MGRIHTGITSLTKIKSLKSAGFPIIISAKGFRKKKPETLKIDAITKENFSIVRYMLARWQNTPKIFDRRTKEIYKVHVSDTSIKNENCISYKEATNNSSKIEYGTFFIASKDSVEGIIKLEFGNRSKVTMLHYMGVAPWNIRTPKNEPKFRGLSMDLFRLSLLFALNRAQNENEDPYILMTHFMTPFGMHFGRKLMGQHNTFPERQTLVLGVRKSAAIAFINNDIDGFRSSSILHHTLY